MGAQDTAERLRAINAELSGLFYERDDVIRTLTVAMPAGQHALLLGPPALSRGEYRQIFDGRATTAHIAFIDEIFKCSTAAPNETLGLLNERIYHPENGGEPIHCPLISAITASNELPTGDDSAAIYDRLLVRLEVGYLADPSHFAGLVRSAVAAPAVTARTTVQLSELQQAVTGAVPAVGAPDAIADAVCILRAALRRKELIASDRRWRQSVRLLQASAFLDALCDNVRGIEDLTDVHAAGDLFRII